jgi:hypothetical protein
MHIPVAGSASAVLVIEELDGPGENSIALFTLCATEDFVPGFLAGASEGQSAQ